MTVAKNSILGMKPREVLGTTNPLTKIKDVHLFSPYIGLNTESVILPIRDRSPWREAISPSFQLRSDIRVNRSGYGKVIRGEAYGPQAWDNNLCAATRVG
jgi:hypothetical protein